jgi:hypothetical protein
MMDSASRDTKEAAEMLLLLSESGQVRESVQGAGPVEAGRMSTAGSSEADVRARQNADRLDLRCVPVAPDWWVATFE